MQWPPPLGPPPPGAAQHWPRSAQSAVLSGFVCWIQDDAEHGASMVVLQFVFPPLALFNTESNRISFRKGFPFTRLSIPFLPPNSPNSAPTLRARSAPKQPRLPGLLPLGLRQCFQPLHRDHPLRSRWCARAPARRSGAGLGSCGDRSAGWQGGRREHEEHGHGLNHDGRVWFALKRSLPTFTRLAIDP